MHRIYKIYRFYTPASFPLSYNSYQPASLLSSPEVLLSHAAISVLPLAVPMSKVFAPVQSSSPLNVASGHAAHASVSPISFHRSSH